MEAKTDITKGQIAKVQKAFSRYVLDFSDMGVSDYEYSIDKVRVFVDFGFCLRKIDIKKIEILDDDYEEIHSENALAIRHSIEEIIVDYNKRQETIEEDIADELEHRKYVMFHLYY